MDTQLDIYKKFLLRNGQKESTIKIKIKSMRKVLNDCPILTVDFFSKHIIHLQEDQLTDKYINQVIGAVKYWGECFKIEGLKEFPYCKLRRFTDFSKATMSDEEIDSFLQLPYHGRQDMVYRKRYEMFTLFFYIQSYTGMRPGEVAKLTINDIDFGRNIFRTLGKTGPRDVPISPVLIDKLQKYIYVVKGKYLFPSMHESASKPHIGPQAWESQFNQRIVRLGIKRRYLTAYSLRHSFITRQIDEDVSIAKVQKIVGHRKLDTTAQYIHLSTKAIQEVVAKDRLVKRHLDYSQIMRDIYERILFIEKEYQEKIFVNIEKNMIGNKMIVSFEVKDESQMLSTEIISKKSPQMS